jgi:uncharacterized protein YbaR (Trm112 family)
MLLDLAEVLACPRCGPPQALLVLVQRMDGRRVLEGGLACPTCDARFELHEGNPDFRRPEASAAPGATERSADAGGAESGIPADEDAVIVAALLGIRDGSGLVVVGPGLESAASRICALCGGCEVLRLGVPPDEASPTESSGSANSRETVPPTSLLGVGSESLPLLAATVLGVALEAGDPRSIAEATRVLVPGGRLVLLRPRPGAANVVAGEGLELIAEDARAMVARRI